MLHITVFSSFQLLTSVPLLGYAVVYYYCGKGCFQFSTVMTEAAMNILV